MRSTFLLLKDIQNVLTKAFADFRLDDSTETGGLRQPLIVIGHVPPKRSMPTGAENKTDGKSENETVSGDPPIIIIRFLDDVDGEDKNGATVDDANVGIFCIAYSQDSFTEIEAGYQDIMNMSDRVKIAIVNNGRYWENNHWWREGPIKRTTGIEKELAGIYEAGAHDHPFYGAAIVATFKSPAIPRPPFSTLIKGE